MADVARALGTPQPIRYKDKEYPLAPFTWGMVGDFEVWLEDRAWAKVERMKGIVPEEVYQARLDSMGKQIAAGAFGSGTRAFADAMQGVEGQKRVIFLMLRAGDKSVTPALVEEMTQEMFAELMARVKELNADPNPTAAAVS